MTDSFDGYVLRGARLSPVNSETTNEPTTGVIRDARPVPTPYVTDADAPEFVDAAADQYRTAILEAPGSTPTEYLVWAQNTSQLTLIDDSTWWSEDGAGSIPVGTRSVFNLTPSEGEPTIFTDGSDRVVVSDNGNRSLGSIIAVVVARGDEDDYDDGGWVDEDDITKGRQGSNPYLVFTIASTDQQPEAGLVTLTSTQWVQLSGGLSVGRGDRIITVRYTVAPSRFWWTRNDRYEERFGWDNKTQRWAPYKGSTPRNLGRLLFDTSYQLNPWFANLPIGSVLAGDAGQPDSYATLRMGANPGATSVPVAPDSTGTLAWDGIQVRADQDIADFDFDKEPSLSGVVGQVRGELVFNPEFVAQYAGQILWYVFRSFAPDETGLVGDLQDAGSLTLPLFIAPIPGPTDRPLLRLDNRQYLSATLVDTDAELLSADDPAEGEIIVSLSTGRLRLSPDDISKADPESSSFDKHYLGASIVYDGVALNQVPQPVKAPVQLVGDDGLATTAGTNNLLFVPENRYLPDEFADLNDKTRGLGISGVLDAPDGTGAVPSNPADPASVRPGGDDLGADNVGRIRQVEDGVGDTILFSRKGALLELEIVNLLEDLPNLPLDIDQGTAYIAREAYSLPTGEFGSPVALSRADREMFAGDPLYFLQASFTPAVYTEQARLVSRGRDIFRFDGDEVLYFALDTTAYQWLASSLPAQDFYTASEVADSINSVITATGQAYEKNGRVVLEGVITAEVGFGDHQEKNLSGATALGFLPGWKSVNGLVNWLPDSGISLGLFRSPVNRDRSDSTPDYSATARIDNSIIQESIQPSPFVFLQDPPLQDVAGLDEGVFFSITTVVQVGDVAQIVQQPLQHYEDIVHRFGQDKFDWIGQNVIAETVDQATSTIYLQQPNIVEESLLGAPGIGGGLYVSEDGGAVVFQDPDDDYILVEDGVPGNVLLVNRFGRLSLIGAQGEYTANSGVFTDSSADFSSVTEGSRLKVTSGTATGSYLVQSVDSSTQLTVSPVFLSTADNPVTWELYEGYSDDVYDPTLVADMSYKEFNHLQSEPFKVKLLSYLGLVPTSVSAQASSRLSANMDEALANGRVISVRYGVTDTTSTVAQMVALQQEELGIVANNALGIPDTSSNRFSSESFSIRVGTATYTHGAGTLVGVSSFSSDPGSTIEYLLADYVQLDGTVLPKGRLKFGSQVLDEFESSQVLYLEEFQPPADLSGLTVEYNSRTGDLNISSSDITTFGGVKAYFVQQMITENRQDVTLSPLDGTFAFQKPVPKESIVEVNYYEANLEGKKIGDEIQEFIPVFVRDEQAQRQSSNVYLFNSDLKTVDQTIEPIVFVGAVQQNFGVEDFVVDYPAFLNGQGRITFVSKHLEDWIPVTVTYAILEGRGGERVYETSKRLVYRPPFFITEGQERFGLRGNRTSEFVAGQMFRFGDQSFYVVKTKYFPPDPDNTLTGGDVTAVYIFPETTLEVGSRSPANDVLALVTEEPITTVVDPDGATPTPTTAPAGFMSIIDIAVFPFEPINRGQKSVTFLGDLTEFAVAGHILEMAGLPFTIAQVELNEDGTRTKITVTSPFLTGISVEENPTVKLSYRPVYPPDSRDFLGPAPLATTENIELVLFGETDADGNELPGRTLSPETEYSLDSDTGVISLLEPIQSAFQPGQKLFLSHTKVRQLQPFFNDGVVAVPRIAANYLHGTIPSEQNGLLGGLLTGTYSFRNPDTFYWRVVQMSDFVVEAAQEAVQDITSQQSSGGSIQSALGQGSENWEKGVVGLKSQRRHLSDKDRAARAFLDFYNTTILAFEQIDETISGGFIGDRDGKFRFWVGRDKQWPTPGYEDSISGLLTQRNVFSEVFNEANPEDDVFILQTDPIVEPLSVTLGSTELSGDFPDPDRVNELLSNQQSLIRNDVDDLVLVRQAKPEVTPLNDFPFIFLAAQGIFKTMGERHRLSRIFPTLTKAFLLTYPGVGGNPDNDDFGVYTWGRVFDDEMMRTYGETIGQLRNPVLGDITNVATAALSKRRARARIWGYFPDGIPQGAFGDDPDNPGFPTPAITDPVIIAVPTLLRNILIDPMTGYPSREQFISQTGDIPDAEAGDQTLIVPGFETGDQLSWGVPTGETYPAYNGADPISVFGRPSFTGVFVQDVLYGCVITLQDSDENPITDPANILVGISQSFGIPADEFPIEQGDTLFVGPPVNERDSSLNDPPQFSDIAQVVGGLDVYRTGFDLLIKPDGRVVDNTFPSQDDPTFLAIKELLGQNPPEPFSHLGGPVEFFYEGMNPLLIPALAGTVLDDSGDYQLPYIRAANTELDRFDEATVALPAAITTEDDLGGYVYPDEIIANDGLTTDTPAAPWLQEYPAVLATQQDAEPVAHGSPDQGIGDVRSFDVLLVETEAGDGSWTAGAVPTPTQGPQGIHSVGRLTTSAGDGSRVETPRFVTQTTGPPPGTNQTGSPVRYTFTNAMCFVDGVYPPDPQVGAPPPGIEIIEDTINGVTLLDFSSLGQFALNDGTTPVPVWPLLPSGNLNDIWSAAGAKANNIIRIDLISRPDLNVNFGPLGGIPDPPPTRDGGVIALTIEIQGGNVTLQDYEGNVYGPFPLLGSIAYGSTYPVPLPNPLDNKQIIIPQIGMIPWGVGVVPPGLENQWFLPHSLVGGVFTMLYGFEFSIDVDTMVGGTGESTTSWVDADRLTFHEVFDLRMARKRGFQHSISGLDLEAGLVVNQISIQHPSDPPLTPHWSTINEWVNGYSGITPIPLTFVPSYGLVDPDSAGGDWVPLAGAVAEFGSIRAMAFEGHGNTPLQASGITFSAVPSDNRFFSGVICDGTGKTGSKYSTALVGTQLYDDRLVEITVANGGIANVESGDILAITRSADSVNYATTKVGTFIVRHAVEPNVGNLYRQTSPYTYAGSEGGWCPASFPTVVSFDPLTDLLTISDLAPTPGGDVVGGQLTGFSTNYGANPRIYIIRNANNLASTDVDEFRLAVISAQYTNINAAGDQPVFTLTNYQDALAGALTADEFEELTRDAYDVSGMVYWPVNVSGDTYGLPDNNCVGYNDPAGVGSVSGFRWVTFRALASLNPGLGSDVAFDGSLGQITTGVPAPGDLVVDWAWTSSHNFIDNEEQAIYHHVIRMMNIENMTQAQWNSLNGSAPGIPAGPYLFNCILPGTMLALTDFVGPSDGHYAQAGIFLEPSTPRSSIDMVAGHQRVVDATHNLPDPAPLADEDRELGMRDAEAYRASGAPLTLPELVTFEVRRIRRFHEVQTESDSNLTPLRYAYEIRRGRITAYATNAQQRGIVTAQGFVMDWESTKPAGAPKAPDVWDDQRTYSGTNLGEFGNGDVNVHAGDLFRLIDQYGDLVEEVEIAGILNGYQVKLQVPGITQVDPVDLVGMRFEIYLRRPPVPHEQSYEQLLELIISQDVTRTFADWDTDQGGYVPEFQVGDEWRGVANHLYDDLNSATSAQGFAARGVRVGDIVIVDPIGKIPWTPAPGEESIFPIGDMGISDRAEHEPGGPDDLDDNRGFYRVVQIDDNDPPHLEVSGESTFSGTLSSDVTFPEDVSLKDDFGYAVYPTVTDSQLNASPYVNPSPPNNREGQMDLRPTRSRDGTTGSFKDYGDGLSNYSIRPFSYRVIRSSGLFSDEAVDLVLSGRERMLSLIQLLWYAMRGYKSGRYFVFQRDEHCSDLGSPTNAFDGLGLLTNDYIITILGEVGVVPYLNNSLALSLLDRRFWILDTRLDSLTTDPTNPLQMIVAGPGDTPYTSYNDGTGGAQVRPVLPDRVRDVLDRVDRFRQIRYIWLAYRTHTVLGTLAAIRRFDDELEDRLEQQNRVLTIDETTGQV